jgi:hypothetical protein
MYAVPTETVHHQEAPKGEVTGVGHSAIVWDRRDEKEDEGGMAGLNRTFISVSISAGHPKVIS